VEELLRELRQASRALFRRPILAGSVVALLGIGIGTCATIFGICDALLLKPLAVSAPHQLDQVGIRRSPDMISYTFPYSYYRIFANLSHSFSGVFASSSLDIALASGTQSQVASGEAVSGNYFAALGLAPAIGRLLTAEDELSGRPVVVLSYDLWRAAFAGRQDIVGRKIYLRGDSFEIIGVLRPPFAGLDLDRGTTLWIPMSAVSLWLTSRENSHYPSNIYVRLKQGVSLPVASGDLQAVLTAIVETDPGARSRMDARRSPVVLTSAARGASALRKQLERGAGALVGFAVALLLIVCANVGTLLLALGETRRYEVALQLSLGGSAWRVVRRTLLEISLLCALGTLGGCLFAYWLEPILVRLLPFRGPIGLDFSPDIRIVAFLAATYLVVAVLTGGLLVLQFSRMDPWETITQRMGARNANRNRGLLIVMQVALSTCLMIGCFLMLRTVGALRGQDTGFRRSNVIVVSLNPRIAGFKGDQLPQLFDQMIHNVEAIPGVTGVTLMQMPLMHGTGFRTTVAPFGTPLQDSEALKTSVNYVSAGSLQNLGISLVRGRDFRVDDVDVTPHPAIINQAFVARYFRSVDPIGRSFGSGAVNTIARSEFTVVGIIHDAKYRNMREQPSPTFYVPIDNITLRSSDGMTLYVVVAGRVEEEMNRIRHVLRKIGPGIPSPEIGTMEGEIEASLWHERLLAVLATVFAALALVSASVGLFGQLAFTISQRLREIGIRVALGAKAIDIIRMVVIQAAWMISLGMVVGFAGYSVCSRFIQPVLFGVQGFDKSAIAASAAAVILACAIATALPAIRAARVDPAEILRAQ
jgi:putative ABC transport system permease protein